MHISQKKTKTKHLLLLDREVVVSEILVLSHFVVTGHSAFSWWRVVTYIRQRITYLFHLFPFLITCHFALCRKSKFANSSSNDKTSFPVCVCVSHSVVKYSLSWRL